MVLIHNFYYRDNVLLSSLSKRQTNNVGNADLHSKVEREVCVYVCMYVCCKQKTSFMWTVSKYRLPSVNCNSKLTILSFSIFIRTKLKFALILSFHLFINDKRLLRVGAKFYWFCFSAFRRKISRH